LSKWTAHIVAALGHRDQALALGLFPGELPRSSNGFGFFAILALGGLLIGLTALHLSNNALALHLPFEGLESLIDIVVANEDLQLCSNRVAAAVACGQLLTNSACRFAKTNRNLEPGRVTFTGTFGVHRLPTRRLGGFHAQTSQWPNFLLECLLQSHERSVFTSGNGDATVISRIGSRQSGSAMRRPNPEPSLPEKPSIPVAFWSETAELLSRRSRFK
jgi:hypothetical protein